MSASRHAEYARYCAQVYDRPDRQLKTVREVDCLCIERDGLQVLAFRGTEFKAIKPKGWRWRDIKAALNNVRDVIRDLMGWPWRDDLFGVYVHTGFGLSAKWWVDRFAKELSIDQPVVITGHSLGAGIAPHVARRLHDLGFNVVEVVLFGEPKGHYKRSKRHYQDLKIPTISYRNQRDWIKYAGFGSSTVKPVILYPGDVSIWDSHDIDLYADVLSEHVEIVVQ